MRRARATEAAKGWLAGPWDGSAPIPVGFANEGPDEPHLHSGTTEIYLVARGTSRLRVENETVELRAGDAVVVEPGEAHTFLWSSDDYLHFVAHTPGLTSEETRPDKQPVPRSRLGL